MKRFAIVNARIVLPEQVVTGHALIVEESRIAAIVAQSGVGSGIEVIDAAGAWLTPGLIDIHTHGALGYTFNEPSGEAFAAITRENARHGVTSLLATMAAAPISELTACFDFVRSWRASAQNGMGGGAQVLGVHLESPYINPAQAGALNREYLRTPDDGSADALLPYADVLRILVLAPELPGSMELIRKLTRAGIVAAAGHTMAKDEHILTAMTHGLRHVTHIWSAMSSTVREGPWRKPGLVESALTFEGLTVEMIADNRHLPPTLMKLATRCIEPERLCVISDATSGAGLPEGASFHMAGMAYEVSDGVGMMLDRTAFGGSTTLLNQMIPVLIDVVGVPLPDAIRMATLTPATVIGCSDRKGSIAPGKDADLVIFNEDFKPLHVIIGGQFYV